MASQAPAIAQQAPAVARRIDGVSQSLRALFEFQTKSVWSRRRTEAGISDFTFGNPHDMPLPGFVRALQTWSEPLNKDWFAYKMSEPETQEVVASSLRALHGLPFEPQDIVMTTGGFAAIVVALKAVTDPGDEVLINLPPWFCYEPLLLDAGLTPVKVTIQPEDFDLDIDAIAAALTPRTRVVVVNTPHNPTGRIYPPETLTRLAVVLEEASARFGRAIYILSDEPYARIVFDGNLPVTPAAFYSNTLIAYSYGKVLLTPGERIGYLAIAPGATAREQLREAAAMAGVAAGWAFPNATLQHAIADLEELSVDIGHLQRKRDRMVRALREIGYQVHVPQGTFYLLPRSPLENDVVFAELLAERDVFVLPGRTFEMPGYFRISLTANDEMIERSLAGFAEAFELAQARLLVDAIAADGG